jgi:glycosyltransferase involved in cell wall biosynthesis
MDARLARCNQSKETAMNPDESGSFESPPILSVIIPCYNCAETLTEAVDSIYNQTNLHTPFEVVLVNDASTDTTEKIIQELSEKHPNLRCFSHKTNKGGGATRNTAVEHARGKLIFCLDSDDLLGPETLQKLVDYQNKRQCDGVGISTSIKFKGKNINDIAFTNHFSYVGEKIPFASLLEKDGIYCSLYSTFLITKQAFHQIGGYPTEHGFDTQGIAWRFLAHGLIAYTCPDTIYLHRIQFHRSYYSREADAGKVNYNWQDIFLEHFYLFNEETQEFISSFDCRDFSRNIFEELKNRNYVFKENYQELLGHSHKIDVPAPTERVYIRRNSTYGLYLRIKGRLRKIVS